MDELNATGNQKRLDTKDSARDHVLKAVSEKSERINWNGKKIKRCSDRLKKVADETRNWYKNRI